LYAFYHFILPGGFIVLIRHEGPESAVVEQADGVGSHVTVPLDG